MTSGAGQVISGSSLAAWSRSPKSMPLKRPPGPSASRMRCQVAA